MPGLKPHVELFPPLFVQLTSLTMCNATSYFILSLLPEMQEVGCFRPPQVGEREKTGEGGTPPKVTDTSHPEEHSLSDSQLPVFKNVTSTVF